MNNNKSVVSEINVEKLLPLRTSGKRRAIAKDKVQTKIKEDIDQKLAAKKSGEVAVSKKPAAKTRGRKRERDDKYFDKAHDKVDEIKNTLKTAKQDGMTVKERQRLRNQISAQQSRIRKKEEVIFLNKVTREKDAQFM